MADSAQTLATYARRHQCHAAFTRQWRGGNRHDYRLGDKFWLSRIRRVIEASNRPLVIIIDSFRPVLGGVDENHGSAVIAVLKWLDRISKDRRVTWLIIAHEAKGKGTPKNAMAGSTAPYNWADVALRFSRSGRKKATISVTKGRNLGALSSSLTLDVREGANGALELVGGERVASPEGEDEAEAYFDGSSRHLSGVVDLKAKAYSLLAALENTTTAGPWSRGQMLNIVGGPKPKYPELDKWLSLLIADGRLRLDGVSVVVRYSLVPSS